MTRLQFQSQWPFGSSTYSVSEIEDEKPYKAELQDNVWKVRSTLSKIKPGTLSYATMSEADIDQESGCILSTSHPTYTF